MGYSTAVGLGIKERGVSSLNNDVIEKEQTNKPSREFGQMQILCLPNPGVVIRYI